jgi:predicted metal-dependent HD superfamily phosphohydrolase
LTLPRPQQAALQHAYATPPRQYHGIGHVAEVLRHYGQVDAGPGWAKPVEVWLAVLYHDAVYHPGRRDNEARSAAMAVDHIGRWLPDRGVDSARVARLIELTARHGRSPPAISVRIPRPTTCAISSTATWRSWARTPLRSTPTTPA